MTIVRIARKLQTVPHFHPEFVTLVRLALDDAFHLRGMCTVRLGLVSSLPAITCPESYAISSPHPLFASSDAHAYSG